MSTVRRIFVGAAAAVAGLTPAAAAFAATAHSSTSPPPSGSSGNPGPDDNDNGPGTGATPQKGDTWHKVKAEVMESLDNRVVRLANLTASVQGAKTLTPAHQSTLEGLLGTESQGIQALLTKVKAATQANTTLAMLRQDATIMIDQYRVYLVMTPQVQLTEQADNQAALEAAATAAEPQVDSQIKAAGSPPGAVAAYNDMVSQLSDAGAATSAADVAAVLQVTPSGYPADRGPLTQAPTALKVAGRDLASARADLQDIRAVLHSS